MKTIISDVKTSLDKDKNYKYLVDQFNLVDEETLDLITDTFRPFRNEFYNVVYMKDHYKDGVNFSDFYISCIGYIANKTHTDFNTALDNVYYKFYEVAQTIRHYKPQIRLRIDNDTLCNVLLYLTFVRAYIGFVFEYVVKEYLKSKGYKVIESEILDNLKKIDLLLVIDGVKIAIQCKSETFNYLSKTANKYRNKFERMILNKELDSAVYVRHSKDGFDVVDSTKAPTILLDDKVRKVRDDIIQLFNDNKKDPN